MHIGQRVYIAPTATLIGNIQLGDEASIWFGAVLRGDNDLISIGSRSNVQDGVIMHADPGMPVQIGKGVVIGHGVIVHGATVDDGSLIGMRATLLNRVKVGKGCIIGAHSLLTEGTEVPDYSLVMGAPAKVIRQLTEEQIARIANNANHYVALAQRYLNGEFPLHIP